VASPVSNFSGLASGIDTNALVESLMQLERAPITRFQIQRAGFNNRINAWTAITTKASEFRTAVDAVSDQSDFDAFVGVESTDDDALGVQLTGSPATSSVTLNVIQLAATHQVAAGSFSTSDALVGAGTFSITDATGTTDFATNETTTLAELAQQINASSLNLNATIIQVNDTDQRLMLTASDSGADATFTIGGDLGSFASVDVVAAGADAIARIGDPVTGLDITRSSNIFSNVIEGVTLDLKQAGTGSVTVSVTRDSEAAVSAVTSLVEAANGLLSEVARQTAFNPDTNTSSPLTNDATARNLVNNLRATLGNVVNGSATVGHLGALGIELTRDGIYSIDESKLRDVIDNDFDSVAALFARTGTISDPRATYLGATGLSVAGSYEVVATTAAEVPTITGTPYVASSQFEDLSVTFGGQTAVIGIAQNSTLAEAITQINDALSIFGLDQVLADESSAGGAIRLTTPNLFGSSFELEVTNDDAFGLNALDAGVDVAGTIGGETAAGTARTLLGTAGDPEGVSVLIKATVADLTGGPLSLGNVAVSQGLAGGLDAWLDLIEGVDGQIARARGEWDDRIEGIDDNIADFEDRMIIRETRLRREFTAMEVALSQLQSQGQFLAGLFTQPGN